MSECARGCSLQALGRASFAQRRLSAQPERGSGGDERGTDKRVPSRLTHHCSPLAHHRLALQTSSSDLLPHADVARDSRRAIFSGARSPAARYSERRRGSRCETRPRLTQGACCPLLEATVWCAVSLLSKSHMHVQLAVLPG